MYGQTDRRDALQRRLSAGRRRATLTVTLGSLLLFLARTLLLPSALLALVLENAASRAAAKTASAGRGRDGRRRRDGHRWHRWLAS